MNIEDLYSIYKRHNSVCTDTRKIKPNDIYFALKGDNFDGNAFAVNAIDAGASYAVVDDISLKADHFSFPNNCMQQPIRIMLEVGI